MEIYSVTTVCIPIADDRLTVARLVSALIWFFYITTTPEVKSLPSKTDFDPWQAAVPTPDRYAARLQQCSADMLLQQ